MTIPILWVIHMATGHRTYQWVNGRIQDVGSMRSIEPKEALPPPEKKAERRRTGLDLQTGLLVFTCSSLVMVFAGGALCALLFILYAIFVR
jgi:hypothetical protein